MLAPLRVVELSAFIAAPYAGLLLAQMGADVIRVDPLGGGPDIDRWPLAANGDSLYWAGLNKGKRSVALDTRSARGRELVAELITRPGDGGGVMLTNLAARHELALERLQAKRADLIALQIRGHHDGQTAVDYTVNAAVGVPLATGQASADAPVNNMLPAWDALAGAHGALALAVADARRRRSGQGESITMALSDVGYAFISHIGFTAEAELYGRNRPAVGNHIYGALGHDLGCADGRRVMLAAVTDSQWRAILDATGLADAVAAIERALGLDFSRDGDRYQARDILVPLFEQWTRRHTLAKVAETFNAHGVCWGPYQSFTQLVGEDPRFSSANPMIGPIEQPGIGTFRAAGLPLAFGSQPDRRPKPAPRLGQHTEQVLIELLGLSNAQFGALVDAKVAARG